MDGQTFDRILSEHNYVRLEALSTRRSGTPSPGLDIGRGIAEVLDDAVESRLRTFRRTSRRCIPRSCSGNWRLA